jgi:UDP-N-acetylmuramoyl-tripeptide--D-alanyl-D-alanine ligase
MPLWTKTELLEALEGELLQHNLPDDLIIDEVVIDSRKAKKNSLFIAIKGEKNDGHDFLAEVASNGCKLVLIHDPQFFNDLRLTTYNLRLILVKNTFTALYSLAKFSRKRSAAKIIAITGSVGKTGTKEMLKLLFDSQGKTFATAGNLNNHFGVPLSLCNFSRDCEFGIFELGMNHLGEIEPLSRLVQPHLALITNVGPVHIEFFKNEEEIALAKSEIFCGILDGGIALINRDNRHFEFLRKRAQYYAIVDQNIITFGEKNPSDYQIIHSKTSNPSNSIVETKLKNGEKIYYEIATSNPAIIFNSTIAIACLDLIGNNLSAGISALRNLQTFSGRGNIKEIKIGEKNITIIDDTYNASIPSMRAGLEHVVNLKNILGKKRVVVALGDMRELGEKSVELHEEVTNYLQQLHVDFALLVGENMTAAAKKLPKDSYKTFPDSTAAALEIKDFLSNGDILYVKGSRGVRMEKVIEKITN